MLPIDELIRTLEYYKDNAEVMSQAFSGERHQSFNEGKAAAFRIAIDHIRKIAERDYRLGQYYENRRELV